MNDYEEKLHRVEDDLLSLRARLNESDSERYKEYLVETIGLLEKIREQYEMMIKLEQ